MNDFGTVEMVGERCDMVPEEMVSLEREVTLKDVDTERVVAH